MVRRPLRLDSTPTTNFLRDTEAGFWLQLGGRREQNQPADPNCAERSASLSGGPERSLAVLAGGGPAALGRDSPGSGLVVPPEKKVW